MKDARVVELFRICTMGSRDERAWHEFVLRFQPRLRAGVARVLRRLDQAATTDSVEDLVQDVYCRLLERGAGAFRGDSEGEVLTYLQRVCESVVVDRLRGRATAKRGGRAHFVELGESDGALVEVVADGGSSPEARCLNRELRGLLLDGCRGLLDGQWRERNLAIFELAVLDGWTSREIAQRFDCGLKTGSIDSVIHRQRRKLKQRGLEAPPR
jgi:RNA polymerase sigma factor (sigma-70 family)